MNILVSSCLLGLDCRYCGQGSYQENIAALSKTHQLIPMCPEQLGGLPTPRPPVELVEGQALTQNGDNVTAAFQKGAKETIKLAKLFGTTHAILKSNSPSCGYGSIYDGTFNRRLVAGQGLTAAQLHQNGITILNETNFQNCCE